ncbi:MAG: tonB periplasmic protein [Deltaproteobacteria bacterium]|nr:tonB periplasmic protein [Deltaproteobacteria bacterium]
METGKQNKLLGICASLGLHGLAAVIMVFSLSGNAVIQRDLGKLDFMWVSFAAKHEPSSVPVPENHIWKAPLPSIKTRVAPEARTAGHIRAESKAATSSTKPADGDNAMFTSDHETITYTVANSQSPASGMKGHTAGREAAGSDSQPLYRENPPPGYPDIARQQGYEGVVLVGAEILVNGRVGEAVIRKSSGYAVLDQSAIQAVKTWKFEPAKKSGIPYKTWAELPVKFVISNHNS